MELASRDFGSPSRESGSLESTGLVSAPFRLPGKIVFEFGSSGFSSGNLLSSCLSSNGLVSGDSPDRGHRVFAFRLFHKTWLWSLRQRIAGFACIGCLYSSGENGMESARALLRFVINATNTNTLNSGKINLRTNTTATVVAFSDCIYASAKMRNETEATISKTTYARTQESLQPNTPSRSCQQKPLQNRTDDDKITPHSPGLRKLCRPNTLFILPSRFGYSKRREKEYNRPDFRNAPIFNESDDFLANPRQNEPKTLSTAPSKKFSSENRKKELILIALFSRIDLRFAGLHLHRRVDGHSESHDGRQPRNKQQKIDRLSVLIWWNTVERLLWPIHARIRHNGNPFFCESFFGRRF